MKQFWKDAPPLTQFWKYVSSVVVPLLLAAIHVSCRSIEGMHAADYVIGLGEHSYLISGLRTALGTTYGALSVVALVAILTYTIVRLVRRCPEPMPVSSQMDPRSIQGIQPGTLPFAGAHNARHTLVGYERVTFIERTFEQSAVDTPQSLIPLIDIHHRPTSRKVRKHRRKARRRKRGRR